MVEVISQGDDRHIFPTTVIQRELFLEKAVNRESAVYNVSFLLKLPGDIDWTIWREALEKTTAAHPVLSTSVVNNGEDIIHLVHTDDSIRFDCLDWSSRSYGQVLHHLEELRQKPIDYSNQPLVRHFLFHLNGQADVAGLVSPHILFDGYSAKIFFEQVSKIYSLLKNGEEVAEEHPPTFFDYVDSVAGLFDQTDTLNFWKRKLQNCSGNHFLTREGGKNHSLKNLLLSAEEYKKIKLFCSRHHIHLPTFFMGVYSLVAHCYGDREGDLLIQSIIGLREKTFLKTVGCFYHVLPYQFSDDLFEDHSDINNLFSYIEKYPQEMRNKRLLSSSAMNSMIGRDSITLFFNFQRHLLPMIFGEKRVLDVLWSHPENEAHLLANDLGNRLELKFFYHERHWPDPDFLIRYKTVIDSLLETESFPSRSCFFLPAEQQIISKVADYKSHNDSFQPVVDTITAHARRHPNREALCFKGQSISYEALIRCSRNYADILHSYGIGKGSFVGICLEPSQELVAGVLAVLMTGAAYVPLNTRYPPERMRTIMEDATPQLILCQSKYVSNFIDEFTLLDLDSITDLDLPEPSANEKVHINENDPAYVIYTSGTSGKPKGVIVSHGNVSRLFTASAEYFDFNESDRWTLFHSIAFDFSVWELFGALVHGGTIIVVPEEVILAPKEFYQLACEQHVTVLNQTPNAFYAFQQYDQEQNGRLNSLRYLIFGGETLHLHKLKPWATLHGYIRPQIFNMYGITETTVHVTCKQVRPMDTKSSVINQIGRPLNDLGVQIVDEKLNPVPPGFAGEICICGAGVAKGYLNRAELTAERFLLKSSLFAGDRFYRSGDLGRILPDGELEYLGRLDKQLKIRGFRIEPGEIEAALMCHPVIREALVTTIDQVASWPRNSSGTKLAAYITLNSQEEPEIREIRALLREKLPEYMIPSAYIFLDQFPITDNGKIDIHGLPLPQREDSLDVSLAAPRTDDERLIAELFADVLEIDNVGIHDDFFQLGGHSLAVVRLAAQFRKRTGKDLALCAVFQHPTAAELAKRIDMFCAEISSPFSQQSIDADRSGMIPLSDSQERVWSLIQMNPENRSYEFLSVFEIWGPLQIDLLHRSLQMMVDRHEIYRTTFHEHRGKPCMKIHRHWPVELHVDRASKKHEPVSRELLMEEALDDIRRSPFCLETLPLARWRLTELGEDHFLFLHFEHHLLHDGWSFVVFVKELFEFYTSLVEKRPASISPLALHFSEFVVRQRKWLKSVEQNQLRYWTKLLEKASFTLPLPVDKTRPKFQTFTGKAIRSELSPELREKISLAGQRSQSTLFMFMIAAFAFVLAKYSRQYDIVIGSSFANRRWPETENLLGMLINNLPLRFQIDNEQSVSRFIQEVRERVIAASEHQDIPFNKIVDTINPTRSPDMNPLFQTLFTAYEGPIPDLKLPQLKVRLKEGINTGVAKFDLNVIAICRSVGEDIDDQGKNRQGILLLWEYNTDLFTEDTMRGMLAAYIQTLIFFADHPLASLSETCWISEKDSETLVRWGVNSTTYPRDSSVHDLFTDVARRHGRKTAVRMGEKRLTYTELEAAANTIASFLAGKQIGPGSKVIVVGRRCPEMIAAYLGILKAGAVYVPLDSRTPTQRRQMIIEETRTRLIFTTGEKTGISDQSADIEIFAVEEALSSDKTCSWMYNDLPSVGGSDPAYIMYTSGSTGRPKGVTIRHRGITRLVINTDYVDLENQPNVLHMAAMSFDASTFEIWAPLLNGGTCVLYPEDVPSIDLLEKIVTENAIDIIWLTSSLFNMIIDTAPYCLQKVKQILVGGEALSVNHMEKARRLLPSTQFINGYGPTENTTFSCCYRIPKKSALGRTVPIGRPIANSEVYILDEWNNLVPPGVPGELFVSGDGLAMGYVELPELTDEKFITADITISSLQHDVCIRKRLYKTGDLARWMPDGNIEYLGRLDDQIKIRGFLVEPAEIRTALGNHPLVRDSAVIIKEGRTSGGRLIAYVCTEPGFEDILTLQEIQTHLAGLLPDYMIPRALVTVDALPLTPNGKLDLEALPEPLEIQSEEEMDNYSEDSVCSALAAIWTDVLQLSVSPGLKENFFDLGGNSLKLIEVHNKIQQQLGKICTVLDLFAYPTLKDLADFLGKEQAVDKFTEQIGRRAQKRIAARRRTLQ